MSLVLTASHICARALRAIGEFPVTETAPAGEAVREAMHWLDLILAQEVGTGRIFSRIPATLSMTITNGTQSYDLYTTLGASLPTDRIQFVTAAYVQDDLGNRQNVEIVNRRKFEEVSVPAETGPIKWIYIDRLATPTLQIFPTPATTDPRTYTLKLVVQKYAPNVAPGGVTGTQPSASTLHEFGQAWQRWMVCQLAHDLGSGPVRKIPEDRLNRFAKMAAEAKTLLLAFENREHETSDPVCEAPDGWID